MIFLGLEHAKVQFQQSYMQIKNSPFTCIFTLVEKFSHKHVFNGNKQKEGTVANKRQKKLDKNFSESFDK